MTMASRTCRRPSRQRRSGTLSLQDFIGSSKVSRVIWLAMPMAPPEKVRWVTQAWMLFSARKAHSGFLRRCRTHSGLVLLPIQPVQHSVRLFPENVVKACSQYRSLSRTRIASPTLQVGVELSDQCARPPRQRGAAPAWPARTCARAVRRSGDTAHGYSSEAGRTLGHERRAEQQAMVADRILEHVLGSDV